ncbi:cytochrome c oxidase subunit II [Castellaniella sp. UC4442_H9]
MGYFSQASGPAAVPTMHLAWAITALSVAVIVIIAVMLAAALLRHRPPAESDAVGPDHGGMTFVYVSVGVSVVALLAALVYTLMTLEAVARPSSAPALTITVTAHDWWWEARYQDSSEPGRYFVTANEIHIPTGVPVRIELQSVDVIHSFWVPHLAGKTQAIPGQVNHQWIQADAPGVYRGQCAAFCGAQHAHMAFEVIAQAPAQFEAWRDAQLRPAEDPADVPGRTGRKFFMERCAGCHTVRGTEAQGAFGPDLTHLGSRRRIAAGTLANTPEELLDWVRHAQKIKPESLMPSFSLKPREAAALGAYLATLH